MCVCQYTIRTSARAALAQALRKCTYTFPNLNSKVVTGSLHNDKKYNKYICFILFWMGYYFK